MLNTFCRLIPAALAAALAVDPALSQTVTAHPSPAPLLVVDWGTPMDSVVARAALSGWTFQEVDGDSDLVFLGMVNSVGAVAFATLDKTGVLTRVMISISPHSNASNTYRDLTDTLRSRYGRASLGDQERGDTPAPAFYSAAAWPGILAGLRRDGWITLVFTCPESSPKLPRRRGLMPIA